MQLTIETCVAGRWQSRFASIPPLAWIAMLAAALWPHWTWAAARLADGSDDPLGIAALVVLLLAIARMGPSLLPEPRLDWLLASMATVMAATAALCIAPPLVAALLAALAMVAGMRAFMPEHRPALPLAGLAVLALPLVSSLQFYAGYPLRVVTAELSTWALKLAGTAASRSGSAMLVDGHLVIVDAPCSGVQMVWMAYFCACAVAANTSISDRRFVRRLPACCAFVLVGNVLRNSVLVKLEASGAVAEWVHQGVGLAALDWSASVWFS